MANFDQDSLPTPLPTPLLQFIHLLIHWYGNNGALYFQELISKANCPKQRHHKDHIYPINKKRKSLEDISFSILLALENNDNVTSFIDSEKEVRVFKKGCIVMFRGNYSHGGMSYKEENHRLHIVLCHKDNLDSLKNVYEIEI
jgi:hypothetical protein